MCRVCLLIAILAGALAPATRSPAADPSPEQKQQLNEARRLGNLALQLYREGKYLAAVEPAKQSLALHQRVNGAKHAETIIALGNLGPILDDAGDYPAARKYYEQALTARKEVYGLKHADTSESLNNFGSFLLAQGDFAAARPLLEQALAVDRELHGEKHKSTVAALHNLGRLHRKEGNFAAARPCVEQALALSREVHGREHPLTLNTLNNYGDLLEAQGDLAASRKVLEEVLAVRMRTQGPRHRDTATAQNNLGRVLDVQGDRAAARKHYEQALKAYQDALGAKHPEVIGPLNNLGGLLTDQRDYAGARRYYEQALLIAKEKLGTSNSETARLLNNLGHLLTQQGNYTGARPYYEQAYSTYKATLGPKHPETASSLNNLGFVSFALGDSAASRKYYEQCLAIRQEVLGSQHPDTAISLSHLANIEAAAGKWAAAARRYGESRRAVRRHVARVLPGLTEREQLIYLQIEDRSDFFMALSLPLAAPGEAEVAAQSAEWLLNGKAVAHEALAGREMLARAAKSEFTKDADDLRAAQRELSALVYTVPEPSKAAEHQRRIAAVETRLTAASRKLAAARGQTELADLWIDLDKARMALGAHSVLIDIACMRPANYQSRDRKNDYRPARYIAWITRADGPVKVVDLGEAAVIDKLIAEVQSELNTALNADVKLSSIGKLGEVDAEARVKAKLRDLGQRLFDPLRAHVGDARQLILSPDAATWLVPWSALVLNQGEYAVERYDFRFLASARDLVSAPASKVAAARPSIFADPDYDLALTAGARTVNTSSTGTTLPVSRSLSALRKMTRLPGTAVEAAAIAPSVEKLAGAAPQILLNRDALESQFKKLQSPRALVLSTHGYFLADQSTEVGRSSGTRGASLSRSPVAQDGQRVENPLLRCGLMLAGCNVASTDPRADDGVLTGLEIVGADLRGTELVVLSACETGLGVVNNGEGVAGLRQAFQLAGAKSVVSTLWQIPDKQSAQLMTDFFANLAAGQSKAEALRTAQLTMIKARRNRDGAAHPVFWAAWTVTGN